MRANTMVTLGASAAFGLLSIFLAHSWISDAVHSEFSGQIRSSQTEERTREPVRPSKPVLVADINFAFGDVITAQSLRLVDDFHADLLVRVFSPVLGAVVVD